MAVFQGCLFPLLLFSTYSDMTFPLRLSPNSSLAGTLQLLDATAILPENAASAWRSVILKIIEQNERKDYWNRILPWDVSKLVQKLIVELPSLQGPPLEVRWIDVFVGVYNILKQHVETSYLDQGVGSLGAIKQLRVAVMRQLGEVLFVAFHDAVALLADPFQTEREPSSFGAIAVLLECADIDPRPLEIYLYLANESYHDRVEMCCRALAYDFECNEAWKVLLNKAPPIGTGVPANGVVIGSKVLSHRRSERRSPPIS